MKLEDFCQKKLEPYQVMSLVVFHSQSHTITPGHPSIYHYLHPRNFEMNCFEPSKSYFRNGGYE